MAGKDIQDRVMDALAEFVGEEHLCREWSVKKDAQDTFSEETYAPRLDVGIGPFNPTYENRHRDARAILEASYPLIDVLEQAIAEQNPHFYPNQNPRCLVGIEIEHATSSKHILGGITNASMLGRLGIVIGTPKNIQKVTRIHAYVRKLKEVGKAERNMFGNVGVFSVGEFESLIRAARKATKAAKAKK